MYRHFCSLHAKCVRLCCDELYYAKQISWFAKSVCKIQKCMGTWLLVSKISLGVMMTTATSILMMNTSVTIIMQLWHLAWAGSVSNTGLGSCCEHDFKQFFKYDKLWKLLNSHSSVLLPLPLIKAWFDYHCRAWLILRFSWPSMSDHTPTGFLTEAILEKHPFVWTWWGEIQ